ncbi:MAG: ABC transporter ATP-binding protein/permease [Pseudobutyrivibrio sp.]|nr:ABC transporter ATP-binding protein/permease [Pseudobutyrivibrio sp.]
MIEIMHRLVNKTGRYKARIRWSYLTALIKGFLMKVPMFICFIGITYLLDGVMDERKCLYMGVGIFAAVLLEALFEHLTNVLQSAAGFMVFADMRMELGEHLRKLPMGYFTEGNIGKISSVLSTDMAFIEENCMTVLGELVAFIVSQIMMVGMMFYIDYRIGFISLIFVGLFILIGRLRMKTTMEHSAVRQKCSEDQAKAVIDFAEGISIIKSYNLLGEKSKDLTESFEKNCRENIKFENYFAPWEAANYLAYGIGTSAILAFASFLYITGGLSNTYFVGIIIFLFDAIVSMKSFYGQMTRLTVTAASLDRIDEVFSQTEMADNGVMQIPEEYNGAEVEYEDVTFAYDDKNVIENVSFSVGKDEMVALVGPSGGGKSTIASLLARLWDVKSGSIKIRGVDIRDVPMFDLMNHISMVFQRVYLFQDTVYNNIAISRPDATREEVMEAAQKARCLEFIEKLPNGFDTVLGEGGASLSGGEKQRISIARCLLKDAPIVILDEATASVDADNEKAIQEAIDELVKDKTLIVIAHRLKTVRNADQIFVIDNKGISEYGTHEKLIAKNGKYSKLYRLSEIS